MRHENPAPTGPRGHQVRIYKTININNLPIQPLIPLSIVSLTLQGYKNMSRNVKESQERTKEDNYSLYQALDLFKSISQAQILKLYYYYKHDFEIFGYSAREYLSE